MGFLLFCVAGSVFCALQALFWFTRSRSSARASALLERLGGAASINEVSLLKEVDEIGGMMGGLRERLVLAGDPPDITPFVSRVFLFSMLGGLAGLIVMNSLSAGLAGAIVDVRAFMQLRNKIRSRAVQISKDCPKTTSADHLLKADMRSQRPLTTAAETPGALGEELQILAEELALGRSVEEAFLGLGQRLSRVGVVRTLVVSVVVLQQTGGNLIEVLDQLVDSLHEQSQYARKLAAMTAEGRMSAFILSGLPPVFLALVYLVAPDYMARLFEPGLGLVIFGVALALYLAGFFWVRGMVQPEVS